MAKQRIISVLVVFTFVIIASPPLYSASADAINRHGIQLGKKRLYKEALNEFDRAIDIINKKSAEIYHNKAWTQQSMGDMKGAIKNYEEALKRYPKLIITGEKLGFLYYKNGDYVNAVRIGEHVLKYDPENTEVKRWLPDAYMKKIQQEQARLEEQKKKEAAEKKERAEKERIEKEKEIKERRKFFATVDFMLRSGYYFRGDKGYKYISDPGFLINIPNSINVNFTPIPIWELDLVFENPFLGALSPNLLIYSERIEVLYKLGDYDLGIGFMFNQHKSDIAFQGALGIIKMWDFKGGILFGYKKDKAGMKFTIYPRLLPYDGSSDSNRTFDAALYQIDYTYNVDAKLKYYSIIAAKDFYIFNHNAGVSDYWGLYEIGIGITLGRVNSDTNKIDIAFTIELKEVFYLEDLNNDDPYTRKPNGQSYFGMNSGKWLKGDPFSGYKAASTQFSLKVEEKINKNIFLYQKLLIEMSDQDEDHHEFNLQLGLGVVF